jgi:hypothetical protein
MLEIAVAMSAAGEVARGVTREAPSGPAIAPRVIQSMRDAGHVSSDRPVRASEVGGWLVDRGYAATKQHVYGVLARLGAQGVIERAMQDGRLVCWLSSSA